MSPDRIIEAMVFVSENPVKPADIAEVFQHEEFQEIGIDEIRAAEILEGLVGKFQSEDYPFELKKIDKGYQFFTKKEYFPYLKHAILLKNQKKLSRAALETLSIIAYRQPVTKPEIEFVRGVNCDYAVNKLLDKGLIEICGRSDAPGRPLLYETSGFFMEYFGLNEISDLPKLQEFSIDEGEFQEQFKVYMEEKDDLMEAVEEGKQRAKENQEQEAETETDKGAEIEENDSGDE